MSQSVVGIKGTWESFLLNEQKALKKCMMNAIWSICLQEPPGLMSGLRHPKCRKEWSCTCWNVCWRRGLERKRFSTYRGGWGTGNGAKTEEGWVPGAPCLRPSSIIWSKSEKQLRTVTSIPRSSPRRPNTSRTKSQRKRHWGEKKNLSRGKAFTAMIKIILKRLAIPCTKKKKKITWRKVRLQAKSEDKKVWKRWILFHTKDQYSSFRKYSHM